MKKQAKSAKSPKTKMAVAMSKAVVVHNRRQRFWGIVALFGLFFCGFMLGMDVRGLKEQTKNQESQNTVVQTVAQPEYVEEPQNVCVEIERILGQRLPDETDNASDRIERAKLFAMMAERGCPENTDAFVEHARLELEIARAIENDEFGKEETIEVVETYKRLNMQAAAEEIFEKAKKLTNPAIEFILQVEKIINE